MHIDESAYLDIYGNASTPSYEYEAVVTFSIYAHAGGIDSSVEIMTITITAPQSMTVTDPVYGGLLPTPLWSLVNSGSNSDPSHDLMVTSLFDPSALTEVRGYYGDSAYSG